MDWLGDRPDRSRLGPSGFGFRGAQVRLVMTVPSFVNGRMAPVAARPGRLGYLVRSFPRISETFIINEILELERQGFDLCIYSMIAATDPIRHRLVDQIRGPIRYLPCPVWRALPTIVADHLWLLARAPRAYASVLASIVTRGEWALIARLPQAASLVRALERDGVTHLHAGFVHAPGSLAYLVSRLTGQPYSVATHARDLYRASPALLRRKLTAAQVVFTCTRYNVAHLEQLGSGAAPIRVRHAYHGTSLERFRFGRCGGGEPPVVLAVARLVEKKGLDDLMRACALLHARGRHFQCHVIGTGEGRRALVQQIRELGLEHMVTLEGAVDQDAIVAWYRRATLLALPCRVARDGDRDGIPNVLIEAAACGLPIVTTPVSGIPELIEHRKTGLLVPPRDPPALAGAIDLLLHARDLRERLRANARRKVEATFDLRLNALAIGRELRAVMAHAAGERPGLPRSTASRPHGMTATNERV
jgi:glycosyltransferase involved in cell wall biosynthesis